jgi:DNA-binding IclR family transcriptional regulator
METMISGQYNVRAVTRALDLLVELSTRDQPAGLTELARSVGLHPTTCLRLLESLRSRGFVRETDDRGYLVGSRAFEVGNAFLQNVPIWPKAKQGYAVDNEERTLGVICVGAAVRDHRRRPLGAISISGPARQLRAIGVAALGSAVRETARSIVA